jgi:hypothetical protein
VTFILAEDAALKELLKGMTVSDVNSEARAVEVYYSIPDVEIRQQKYPYLTIDLIDIRPANERQHAGYISDEDFNGTIDTDDLTVPTVFTYTLPVAYDLVYQISSWTRHPYHDRSIMLQMLQTKFPSKYGKLEVPNDAGTGSVNRSMFLDEFVKMSFVEDGRRLFRNIFTVRVISELTPAQADFVSTDLVEQVIITGQDTDPSLQF